MRIDELNLWVVLACCFFNKICVTSLCEGSLGILRGPLLFCRFLRPLNVLLKRLSLAIVSGGILGSLSNLSLEMILSSGHETHGIIFSGGVLLHTKTRT